MTDHICGKYFFEDLALLVREMEVRMGKNEITGYEPLVDYLKQMILQKQYRVLQMVNSETINLYWEIGEEIYRQQEEKGWGKSIVQVSSKELQKEFPGAKGYSAANLWRMRNFYLTYRDSEKLAPLVREIRMKAMLPEPEEIAKRLKIFDD